MRLFRVGPLPEGALQAAAAFHAEVLQEILDLLDSPPSGEDLIILFPPAPSDHRGWRVALVQDLARAAAPARVNAVVGEDGQSLDATLAWLDAAPGVTGQLLALDGNSGGNG